MKKLFLFLFFCSLAEADTIMQKPSYQTVREVLPICYPDLLKRLDRDLSTYNLFRLKAPGLEKISKENVLFFVYADPNKTIRPLVISDVKKMGIIEVQIYREDFFEEKEYNSLIQTVDSVFDVYELKNCDKFNQATK